MRLTPPPTPTTLVVIVRTEGPIAHVTENPLAADTELFEHYMDALNRVIGSEEIQSAMTELGVSGARIRMRLVNDAPRILGAAHREFATYQALRAQGVLDLDQDESLTTPLRWTARAYAIAGAVLLVGGLVGGLVGSFAWAPPAAWAGGTLLVAAAVVMALNRVKDTRLSARVPALDRGSGVLDLARHLLVEAVSDDLLGEVRAHVNAARADRFGHTLAVTTSPGLSEVHNRSYHVSTSAVAQLDTLLGHLAGASIGVAGPRGSGKSTLLRRYCEDLAGGGRDDLRCMVSAPVDYVAKEFVLHLFATFCRSVIGYFSRDVAGRRARRLPSPTTVLWYVQTASVDLLAFAVIPAALLLWRSGIEDAVGVAVPVTMLVAGALAVFGLRRAWDWISLAVRTARRQAARKRLPRSMIARAKRHLDRCRYLQTWSHGWSGSLQLPVAGGGQVTGNVSRAEQLLSYPEVVEQFRRFARHVARLVDERGDRVCIGVDELDKIGSPEQAERFLNEIKGVFGVPHVYFFVSVSDDALTAFERRGLPLRDTFDSSFDEIVRVSPMPYVESRRLLYRRVIGLTETYVALCHCMAGGLPRDLIRAARRIIQTANRPAGEPESLADTAAAVVADDIRRQAAATSAALPAVNADLRRHLYEITAGTATSGSALKLLDELPAVTADDPEDAARIRRDFATYVYFSATLAEIFTERLDTERMIAATAEDGGAGTFDALAAARYTFAQDTRLAWHSITAFREAWQLETRSMP